MSGKYSNERQEMSRIISECAQAERDRVFSEPDSNMPTERCIDGRYISITQKKNAYRALDDFTEFNRRLREAA